jgi:hypothetical protein
MYKETETMGTIADKYANSLSEIGCKPALYAALVALEERIDALQPPQLNTPDSTGKVDKDMFLAGWSEALECVEYLGDDDVRIRNLTSEYEKEMAWKQYQINLRRKSPGEPAPAAPETSVK